MTPGLCTQESILAVLRDTMECPGVNLAQLLARQALPVMLSLWFLMATLKYRLLWFVPWLGLQGGTHRQGADFSVPFLCTDVPVGSLENGAGLGELVVPGPGLRSR